MNKYLCLTLDLEQDYGRIDSYTSRKNIKPLLELLKKYQIKLNVFTVGEILAKKPEMIKEFNNFPAEFELHSYSHTINRPLALAEKIEEIRKAKNAYLAFFNRPPQGYRAPQGVISEKELEILAKENFKYSASLFPSWRPGLFNNLKKQTQPHLTKSGIKEMPFSVIAKIKIPIALSYQQVLGWAFYRIAFQIFGLPKTIVYDFHLYNLSKTRTAKGLPLYLRLAYLRNQNGLKILEKFIKFTKKRGYKTAFMSEII